MSHSRGPSVATHTVTTVQPRLVDNMRGLIWSLPTPRGKQLSVDFESGSRSKKPACCCWKSWHGQIKAKVRDKERETEVEGEVGEALWKTLALGFSLASSKIQEKKM